MPTLSIIPAPIAKKVNECMHHTAYKMLAKNTWECYIVTTPNVITGKGACPLFMTNHKERYAWGISTIYEDVREAFTEMDYNGQAIEFDRYKETEKDRK